MLRTSDDADTLCEIHSAPLLIENYLNKSEFYEIIKESAKELGFNWSSRNVELIIDINREILDYQKRLEIESKKKKGEEFDF